MSYGRSKYDERTKLLGLKSDYKADTLALQAKAGYVLGSFAPEAGLRYMNVAEKAYTDFLGARVSGRTTQTWTAIAGLNAGKDFRFEKGTVSGRVSAAMTYDLTQGGANRTVSLVNGTSYIARGESMPRFGFEIGAGASYKLNEKTEIGLSYDGKYQNKYKFTTCRKYKGLEADAVVLIDVDKETFTGDNALIYYVGASRARLRLDVMVILSDEECRDILTNRLRYSGKIKKAKRDFASALNAVGSLRD